MPMLHSNIVEVNQFLRRTEGVYLREREVDRGDGRCCLSRTEPRCRWGDFVTANLNDFTATSVPADELSMEND